MLDTAYLDKEARRVAAEFLADGLVRGELHPYVREDISRAELTEVHDRVVRIFHMLSASLREQED
jgi:hypothetical protein